MLSLVAVHQKGNSDCCCKKCDTRRLAIDHAWNDAIAKGSNPHERHPMNLSDDRFLHPVYNPPEVFLHDVFSFFCNCDGCKAAGFDKHHPNEPNCHCSQCVPAILAHDPHNPQCTCLQCLNLEDELATGPMMMVDGAAAVTPGAGVATSPQRKRSGTAASMAVAVTPEKAARSTKLTVYKPTANPEGPYGRGVTGPDSALDPFGYGDLEESDKALVNDLTTTSGIYRLKKASDPFTRRRTGAGGADIVDNAAAAASEVWRSNLAEIGIDTSDAVAGVDPFVSEVVKETLYHPMSSVGMFNVATMHDYLQQTDDGVGLALKSNPKEHILFVPVMVRKNQLSEVNNEGKREFINTPHGLRYYGNFWRDNLVMRNLAGGGFFTTLDLGFYQPLWTIPEAQRADHAKALEFMKEHGPVLPNSNSLCLMTLKNEYVHAFVNQMGTQLVAKARLAGYHPIWLMKNCFLQKTPYGLNGYQFSSLNKSPKSYIHLCGFCKGSEEEGNLRIVVLANKNNQFLSITNN